MEKNEINYYDKIQSLLLKNVNPLRKYEPICLFHTKHKTQKIHMLYQYNHKLNANKLLVFRKFPLIPNNQNIYLTHQFLSDNRKKRKSDTPG